MRLMTDQGWVDIPDDELYHFGIKGMKWGVRRYQNSDGSYTSAGRRRYGKGERMDTNTKGDSAITRRVKRDYNSLSDKDFKGKYKVSKNRYRKRVNRYGDPYKNSPLVKVGKALGKTGITKQGQKMANNSKKTQEKLKTAAKVAGTAAVMYGSYKAGKKLGKAIARSRVTRLPNNMPRLENNNVVADAAYREVAKAAKKKMRRRAAKRATGTALALR